MKKYIALLLLVTVSFAFTACDDETEPGGTAVEKMAGTWIVTWEAKNEAGKWEDILGGTVELNTYNTAANVPTEMWVKEGYLLNSAIKVSTDYNARTFSATGQTIAVVPEIWGDSKIVVDVTDGKVLAGAATTPSGMPADSIVFFVNVQGDDTYKIAGFRRTGFPADE